MRCKKTGVYCRGLEGFKNMVLKPVKMWYLVFEVIPKLYNKNIHYELSVFFFLIFALLELCNVKGKLICFD